MKLAITPISLFLFADGHAVQVFEKNDTHAGVVQFCHVHEKWTHARCSFRGRIYFGRGDVAVAELCRKAVSIRATLASLEAGSQGTQEKGIPVGCLTIETKYGCLEWYDMPGTISGCYTYQPQARESFDPKMRQWCQANVSKIFSAKEPASTGLAIAE